MSSAATATAVSPVEWARVQLEPLGIDLDGAEQRFMAEVADLGENQLRVLVALLARTAFGHCAPTSPDGLPTGITLGRDDDVPGWSWWYCGPCRMRMTGLIDTAEARTRAEVHADTAHPGWRHIRALLNSRSDPSPIRQGASS